MRSGEVRGGEVTRLIQINNSQINRTEVRGGQGRGQERGQGRGQGIGQERGQGQVRGKVRRKVRGEVRGVKGLIQLNNSQINRMEVR